MARTPIRISNLTILRVGLYGAWLTAVAHMVGALHAYSPGEVFILLWVTAIGLHVTRKEASS